MLYWPDSPCPLLLKSYSYFISFIYSHIIKSAELYEWNSIGSPFVSLQNTVPACIQITACVEHSASVLCSVHSCHTFLYGLSVSHLCSVHLPPWVLNKKTNSEQFCSKVAVINRVCPVMFCFLCSYEVFCVSLSVIFRIKNHTWFCCISWMKCKHILVFCLTFK